MRANVSNLIQMAREMNLEIQNLNTQRGRYFGTVLGINNFGILIASRANAAVIVQIGDMTNLVERPKTGDQLSVSYDNGKCEIKIRA